MASVKRPITVHVKLAMKARIAQHVFHYQAAKMGHLRRNLILKRLGAFSSRINDANGVEIVLPPKSPILCGYYGYRIQEGLTK